MGKRERSVGTEECAVVKRGVVLCVCLCVLSYVIEVLV